MVKSVRFHESVKTDNGMSHGKQVWGNTTFSTKELDVLRRAVTKAYPKQTKTYRMVKISGERESTSFYRAVSTSLYGSPALSSKLRRHVFRYMVQKRQLPPQNIDHFVAGHTLVQGEIPALSALFRIYIRVQTKGAHHSVAFNESNKRNHAVVLAYNADKKHFDLAVPRAPANKE